MPPNQSNWERGQCRPSGAVGGSAYWCEERFGNKSCASVEEKLHFRDLLVDFLHELNDEIDELVFQHLFGVEVGNQERNVVALDRLPSQDEERLGTLCQEAGELVHQNVLDLVGLLDLDADAYAVDARLDQDSLVLVARDRQRRQQDLGRCARLDLGDIVSLSCLRCEVGEAEGRRQTAAYSLEVRAERLRLWVQCD
jgi:hypothetical protein